MAGSTHQKDEKAGSGLLFYIMGASGAGKDSLLRGCRDHRIDDQSPVVAHRYITRKPDGGTENHVWLSAAEFEQRVTLDAFAMHWSANGHRYGIGREVDQWLNRGGAVLVNGSRGYLEQARSRYGDRLVAVLISVDPACLHRRLVRRGRESSAEIEARVRRAGELQQQLPPDCLVIENNGSLADAVSKLLMVVAERTASGSAAPKPVGLQANP